MTVQECKFFGVRADRLEQSKQCKACQKNTSEIYDKCSKASLKLESTSVVVIKGKTRTIRGPLPIFHNKDLKIERETVMETEKMENFIEETEKSEQPVNEKKKSEQPVAKQKQTRLPRVPGVIEYCLKLMSQNENPTVIEELLTDRYIEAGYPDKATASARAHNIYLGQLREQKKIKN